MRRSTLAVLLSTGLLATFLVNAKADGDTAITEPEARAIGVDAYLYFYPLIAMDTTRKQFTNVEAGKEFGRGPMNSTSTPMERIPDEIAFSSM